MAKGDMAGADMAHVSAAAHLKASIKVLEDAAAIEKMAAADKAFTAARYADTEIWRRDGDRSAAHQLARITGVGVGAAIDTLETARRLYNLPVPSREALAGRLSARRPRPSPTRPSPIRQLSGG